MNKRRIFFLVIVLVLLVKFYSMNVELNQNVVVELESVNLLKVRVENLKREFDNLEKRIDKCENEAKKIMPFIEVMNSSAGGQKSR